MEMGPTRAGGSGKLAETGDPAPWPLDLVCQPGNGPIAFECRGLAGCRWNGSGYLRTGRLTGITYRRLGQAI